jgi:hypothetical protein
MVSRALPLMVAVILALPVTAAAQMTFRLRGTVRDNDGQPVPGVTVRAEAIKGFRGDQFVGQKEFEVTTGSKGDWVILGLTSGIWVFEATGPDVIPQVVVLPVSFTNRKPQSAQGGVLPWDLPLSVRRSKNEALTTAANLTMARKNDEAVAAIGVLAAEQDPGVLCAAGELALFVRQNGLSTAIFNQILQKDPKNGCATLGAASSALMQGNLDLASKLLWTATDLAPREQKPALGAALRDLQAVSGYK